MGKTPKINRDQLTSFRRISGEKRLHDKIIEADRLAVHAEFWRHSSWEVVLATGVFDVLHVGHTRLLQEASYRGDILVVGINSDESVRKLKGNSRPLVPAVERAEILAGLAVVDYVTVFDAETPVGLINMVKPSVFVKGSDRTLEELPEKPAVEKHQGRIVLFPYHRGHSSTSLIERLNSFEV